MDMLNDKDWKDEEENERKPIPINTDRFYPDSYHIADHTPDEDER
jgi:hypothetical protein